MAQLTLEQRATLASNPNFLNSFRAALKKTAGYWATYAGGENNTAIWKRKKFAGDILRGIMPDMRTYAEYFLSKYNEDVDTQNANGKLRYDGTTLDDYELTDSPSTPATYDFFAGVNLNEI